MCPQDKACRLRHQSAQDRFVHEKNRGIKIAFNLSFLLLFLERRAWALHTGLDLPVFMVMWLTSCLAWRTGASASRQKPRLDSPEGYSLPLGPLLQPAHVQQDFQQFFFRQWMLSASEKQSPRRQQVSGSTIVAMGIWSISRSILWAS